MVHGIKNETDNFAESLESESPRIFNRQIPEYNHLSALLTPSTTDYSKQFAHIYAARLEELRKVLEEKVNIKWDKVQIAKLADLEDLEGKECVIIGTLYKHQLAKPSILTELIEEDQLEVRTPKLDYCSENDQVFLEDEMLRIKLVGNQVNKESIVTGIVCAVLGHEERDSTFLVKDWCFPGCVPQAVSNVSNTKKKLVLVSGLNFSENSNLLAVELLHEFICGMAGNVMAQKEQASIVQFIVTGNSIHNNNTESSAYRKIYESRSQEIAHTKEFVVAIQKLDNFLHEIAQCCPVILMPGQSDPTNIMLPQKPLHPCLLPKSSRLATFRGVSNPWTGKIEERVIIGSSGEPITDIMKASGAKDISPIDWLEKTLEWRHLCPTAPDTLSAYPYYQKDRFIMAECPDIYFMGNADKFETKIWKGDKNQMVRIICIPRYSTTQTAVLVDLDSLDVDLICFGTELD